MSIKFEKIKVGDVLYDKRRVRRGNTTISEDCVYTVRIIEIDADGTGATVSWNNNRSQWWPKRHCEKLYRNHPTVKKSMFSR